MAIGNIGNDVIQTFGTAAQPPLYERPDLIKRLAEIDRGSEYDGIGSSELLKDGRRSSFIVHTPLIFASFSLHSKQLVQPLNV